MDQLRYRRRHHQYCGPCYSRRSGIRHHYRSAQRRLRDNYPHGPRAHDADAHIHRRHTGESQCRCRIHPTVHCDGYLSDSSTKNVTSTVTWTSSNTAAATINASGLATGVAGGTSTISATLTGVTGSTIATVAAKTVSSIAVTPANPSFATGATQQFTATATYTDSTTGNITSTATWTSSDTSVATISSSGLATAVATGTTTITATSNTVSGHTTATITAAAAGVNITTWHVDNNRSGLNAGETVLTPTNVNTGTFGKLFSLPIDGYAYAEPLLMSGVTINSAKHNVLYVATEHDRSTPSTPTPPARRSGRSRSCSREKRR